jgi:DNA-binding transcriptional regulator YdaS (Cro superfamily)
MARNAIHPLKLWRRTQRVDGKEMQGSYAAAHVGVSPSSWSFWENGQKVPSPEQMRRIYIFTRGQVRPDHFHDITAWRAELNATIAAAEAA